MYMCIEEFNILVCVLESDVIGLCHAVSSRNFLKGEQSKPSRDLVGVIIHPYST